jgi:predicted small secreted protein
MKMGMKKTVLALGVGIAVGYFAKQQLDQVKKITPEKALKQAKETFKKQGPISGSWIYMQPQEVEKNGLLYNAYRGGVTRNLDGENKQYEFYVDVDTGAVIDSVQTA